jgi:chromosome segregation ATPase
MSDEQYQNFDEDTRKKMDFILEQQAQFAANSQSLQESQVKSAERMDQLEGLVTRLAQVTHAGFKDLTEKINILTDAQIRTEEKVSSLTEAQALLAESQADTSEAQRRSEQAQARMDQALARIAEVQARFAEDQARLTEAQAYTNEAQTRSEQAQARIDKALARIAEVQKYGDERLNILINTVERYISERRNGKS